MFAALRRISQRRLSLPLLVRELLEQSARRRTYILRVVYAALFFMACLLVILPMMSTSGSSPLSVLGIGKTIFISIIGWQFAGVYLFLPAMTCSVLTVEKERNTLGLLFLTRLGPWTIIIEKLLSRLLPMFALMLCSLPLLAFSMSFGGVNLLDITVGVWFLSLTAIQICSLGVACSAFFRTTTGALLACYAMMFIIGFGIPISDWLVFDNGIKEFIRATRNFGLGTGSFPYEEILQFSFIGFVGFIVQVEGPMMTAGFWAQVVLNIVMSIPLITSALVFLVVARLFLVRRAFIPASNLVLNFLKTLDRWFHALNNNRVTRGIVVLSENRSEPDFSPIAWRETHKRSLGQTSYLIRVLLVLEVPVLLMVVLLINRVSDNYYDAGFTMSVTTTLVWLATALLLTVTSAGLIAGERGRQTLDILLALPITGRQIILDKIAGVRRLAWVCAVPLVTCICFEAWWRDIQGPRQGGMNQNYLWWEYLPTALSMVAMYIPLLIWLALWIGLKTKSPTRATLAALVVIVGWCVIPLIMVVVAWESMVTPFTGRQSLEHSLFSLLLQLSPVGLMIITETGSVHEFSPLPLILNVLIYGSCVLVLRHWVLSSADQLLGRTQAPKNLKTSPRLIPDSVPVVT